MKTRFRYGSSPEGINLGPATVTRRIIMQKARGQAGRSQCPPTARRHGVSGSVSSPHRGSSHRSVALLGSLSVVIECLALRDGPRRFRPGFTCPTLLGYRLGEVAPSPTGLSPAAVPRSRGLRLALAHPMSPAPRPRMVSHPVWADPRSLAATRRVSVDFFSSRY